MAEHRTGDSPERLSDLVRQLNLLAYFRAHPQRSVLEAAEDLGRAPQELLEDLARLHTTGTGRYPEELVDLTYSYKGVDIIEDHGLDRALRLTPTEAGTLLLMLEGLENTPGLVDRDAVESAAAKLRGIMDDRAVAIYDTIAEPDQVESAHQALVAQALEHQKQLSFQYFSQSSNSSSVRTVHPVSVLVRDGETYLEAYQESVADYRTFRLDRMTNVTVLDAEATSYPTQAPLEFGFEHTAELVIRQDATWLADYEPITLGEDRGDGMVAATMAYGSTEWMIRFALSHADRLHIIGPKSLVQAVSERKQAGLKRYGNVNGGSNDAVSPEER